MATTFLSLPLGKYNTAASKNDKATKRDEREDKHRKDRKKKGRNRLRIDALGEAEQSLPAGGNLLCDS